MTHEEYEKAANYWNEKDKMSAKMEQSELRKAIEAYIQENDTCALATGVGDFVHCTPIEYKYHQGAFWMFTEGGEKFLALEKNHNVCIAIFDKYQGFGKLKGMQVTGFAELVEPFSESYMEVAQLRKIPVEVLKKMEHPMNLLCIRPSKITFLNSDFKSKGYGSRQTMEL
ncbi:MAG: pyridoxamine 5'-phosphate oxidase family protein [Clostridium sp.]|nr:pyridoxamine 5'-phosphate oxidase family protein [Clostridium sp.]